jgi:thiamine biosynthesis lipoprotein
MGLPVSLLARDPQDGADAMAAAVYAELRAVDARFSPYQEGSEVSRITRGELSLDEAHEDVREVAKRCLSWTERTGGLFDARTPDGTWDPSGLVKGWAVERSARHLRGDWCLNAGGDVVVLTPSGEPFTVGIEDPRDLAKVVLALTTTTAGVATSGTSARGTHLWDPRTGEPASGLLSLTVTGPSLETADVLATAGFVAGDMWRDVLIEGYRGIAVTLTGNVQDSSTML